MPERIRSCRAASCSFSLPVRQAREKARDAVCQRLRDANARRYNELRRVAAGRTYAIYFQSNNIAVCFETKRGSLRDALRIDVTENAIRERRVASLLFRLILVKMLPPSKENTPRISLLIVRGRFEPQLASRVAR